MPKVYIIILNYKIWQDTVECLETVFRSVYENYTVIVIDNNSENDSLEELKHWAQNETNYANRSFSFSKMINKPVRYKYFREEEFSETTLTDQEQLILIKNEQNKGFAGGMNKVLEKLKKENSYIWLLNPDMVVEETTLAVLVEFAQKAPTRSIIGSVIKYYTDPQQIHLYAGGKINFNAGTSDFITYKEDVHQLDYISGGSLFTHANSFMEIGLLPEEYFLYWEEADWCYRAKNIGYSLLLCDQAICYDKVSTTIGKGFLADYYYTRNGLQFLSKFKNVKVPTALFFSLFRFIIRIVSGQPTRARGVYAGMRSFLNKKMHAYK